MRYDKVFGAALIGEEGKLNLNILKYNLYYFHIIEKVLFSCNVKLKTGINNSSYRLIVGIFQAKEPGLA